MQIVAERPETLSAGGTIYALTQTSYDARRPAGMRRHADEHRDLRLRSRPAPARSGTAGQLRPRPITKTVYDAAGQVTQSQVGRSAPPTRPPRRP